MLSHGLLSHSIVLWRVERRLLLQQCVLSLAASVSFLGSKCLGALHPGRIALSGSNTIHHHATASGRLGQSGAQPFGDCLASLFNVHAVSGHVSARPCRSGLSWSQLYPCLSWHGQPLTGTVPREGERRFDTGARPDLDGIGHVNGREAASGVGVSASRGTDPKGHSGVAVRRSADSRGATGRHPGPEGATSSLIEVGGIASRRRLAPSMISLVTPSVGAGGPFVASG